jgi:osmotically-inducible protein OsmY
MTYRIALFLLCILMVGLSGCLSRRSAGTVLDDQNIEYRVIDAIYSSDSIGEESHIKVEVHDSIVLLMGETLTDSQKDEAGALAAEVPHVDRVVNEVQVKESATTGTRFNNSWLTAKVNTALVTGNPVDGSDASRIKVVTSDHTVYLMGLVTREEGDAVAEIARNVSGVEKVVKVFSYTD